MSDEQPQPGTPTPVGPPAEPAPSEPAPPASAQAQPAAQTPAEPAQAQPAAPAPAEPAQTQPVAQAPAEPAPPAPAQPQPAAQTPAEPAPPGSAQAQPQPAAQVWPAPTGAPVQTTGAPPQAPASAPHGFAPAPYAQTAVAEPAATAAPRERRRKSPLVIALIVVVGAIVVAALAWLIVSVVQLQDVIRQQTERIEEQEQEISDLNDLLDDRDAYAAAMDEYRQTVLSVEGVPMSAIVPADDAQELRDQAWKERRTPGALTRTAERVSELTASIVELRTAAETERATNATGTLMEGVLDDLGRGFARVSFDIDGTGCVADALGCVSSADPYVVHLDRDGLFHPAMDDWSRRFVTLHEFAHVMQFTNPDPTGVAEQSFGGDWEFMADCYALRELNAWSLERRVWVSSYEYWDSEIGYGKVCDSAQRDVIGDWITQVGVRADAPAS